MSSQSSLGGAPEYVHAEEQPPGTHGGPLNIIIVGAGIAGLAASLSLRQQGHKVRIFEKSKFGNEVGAAIVLPANIYSLLKRLGINSEEHGANTEDLRSFYSMEGNLMYESDLRGYQGAARLIHRVDLHEALKKAAVAQGVQINLASPAISVDVVAGSITLGDARIITGDVVIGADGIHSVVRKAIIPDSPSPSPFLKAMFRMLVPCSKLAANPSTSRFVNPPGKMSVFMDDEGRRVVSYPCRSNTIMNVAAIFPACLDKACDDDAELKAHMLGIYSTSDPSLIELLASVDKVGKWPLYDLPALGTWSRGRAALMGDAAHPLLPFAAQGGAQALEDAAALAVVLGPGTTGDQVPDRLSMYFEIRHERVNWIQAFARSADQSTPQKPGIKPNMDTKKFFEKVQELDAWADAEARLKGLVGSGGEQS